MKKLNIIIACAIILGGIAFVISCKKAPQYKDVVLITGAESTNVINFAVDTNYSSIALTASATTLVTQDIDVTFKIDTSLLKAYNAANQTNFYIPPAGSYLLPSSAAVIKAGTAVSNALPLEIVSTSKLVQGRTYMIPVTIVVTKGNLGVLKSSGTAFIKINQVITTSAVDFKNQSTVQVLASKQIALNSFTYEFRINMAQFAYFDHISQYGYFQDTLSSSAHTFNLFRFGEISDQINQFQWINSSGKVSSKTLFSTNTWYTISCVFDGNTCSMYINGVLDGSFAAAGQTFNFQQMTIGSSIYGAVDEVRLWSRALSVGEIQNGLCAVDPASTGLLGYWKFNEGTGGSITDYSGHGYTLNSSGNLNWVTGVKCPN